MGTRVSVGEIPGEATSKGGLNEAPPLAQRAPEGVPLGTGPIKGEKDCFLPATYPTSRGNVRTDR